MKIYRFLLHHMTFLTVWFKSAIIYKNAAIPTTFESKSSAFIIVMLSPAVWWYLK